MSERRQVRRKKPRLRFNKRMGRNLGIIYVIIVGFLLVLCGKIAYINVAKGNTYSIHHFAGTWQPIWKKTLLYLWVPLSVKFPHLAAWLKQKIGC